MIFFIVLFIGFTAGYQTSTEVNKKPVCAHFREKEKR